MSAKLKFIVGVDEAGRGPIAGPVSVGVIGVKQEDLAKFRRHFKGAKDCKQLSPSQREAWFQRIKQAERDGLLTCASSLCSNQIIDERGIVSAIKQALRQSLRRLKLNPGHCRVLLDGSLRAPKKYSYQETIIRGDESEIIIALASIVAKVRRDRHMTRLAGEYPLYKFEVHKGYGTTLHYQLIKQHGVSPLHRQSFLTGL